MNHTEPFLILIALIVMAVMIMPVMADNDSMDIDDIKNAKPSIPFAGGFFSMIIGLSKWGAIAGFILALFSIVASGTIATAMDNADMSEKSQSRLFTIAKIVGIAAVVYLAGVYTFETYL